jgi:ABC-type multidrug transport system fused ATPase/permease subunit
MVLITGFLGRFSQQRFEEYQKERLEQKDKRMNIIGEVLSGIRIIKWFTWEENFLAKIASIRRIEIGHLKNFIYTDVIQRTMYSLLPSTVGLVSFVVQTQVLHQPLDPSVGFTSLLLFAILSYPLQELADRISSYSRAAPSLGRITKLLNVRNVAGLGDSTATAEPQSVVDNTTDPAIVFTDVTLVYSSCKEVLDDEKVKSASSCKSYLNRCCLGRRSSADSDKSDIEEGIELNPLVSATNITNVSDDDVGTVVLKNLNFVIPSKALVAVTGLTGSGKSTLILGMLGECRRISGVVSVNDDFLGTSGEGCALRGVSYVSQNAWIQNATIRDNILMGSEYDESRYNAVLKACALELDLQSMTNGDATEIGERGVNLSGGQQQRVNLARAAYSYSKIILMDDPLSAVDAHVGDYIFKHLICEFLQDRTRVLVTHAISLVVPAADLVIMLNNESKSIAVCCAPSELQTKLSTVSASNGREAKQVVASKSGSMKSVESIDRFIDLLIDSTKCKVDDSISDTVACEGSSVDEDDGDGTGIEAKEANEDSSSESKSCAVAAAPDNGVDSSEFIEKEFKAKGTIKWNVYWFYLSACGGIVSSI